MTVEWNIQDMHHKLEKTFKEFLDFLRKYLNFFWLDLVVLSVLLEFIFLGETGISIYICLRVTIYPSKFMEKKNLFFSKYVMLIFFLETFLIFVIIFVPTEYLPSE